MGWYGVDIDPEGIPTQILQQPRVFHSADNLPENLPCLVAVHQLCLDLLAVNPHGKLGNHRPGRKGKDVFRLQVPVVFVEEDLLNLGKGNLVVNLNLNMLVFEGKRRKWRTRRMGRRDEQSLSRNQRREEKQKAYGS